MSSCRAHCVHCLLREVTTSLMAGLEIIIPVDAAGDSRLVQLIKREGKLTHLAEVLSAHDSIRQPPTWHNSLLSRRSVSLRRSSLVSIRTGGLTPDLSGLTVRRPFTSDYCPLLK